MTQNFGPEARGGACSAQLVVSDSPVLYPQCDSAGHHDDQVAGSLQPFRARIDAGGTCILEEDLVRVSNLNRDKKVFAIPATRFAEELGKRMVVNSMMVGFFTEIERKALPF